MNEMMKKNDCNTIAGQNHGRHHAWNSLPTLGTLSELYGETAYQAFLVREAKINRMADEPNHWYTIEIMHLHEQNYRLLQQRTIQPWFIVDVYGNMVPVPKYLPATPIQLRSAS